MKKQYVYIEKVNNQWLSSQLLDEKQVKAMCKRYIERDKEYETVKEYNESKKYFKNERLEELEELNDWYDQLIEDGENPNTQDFWDNMKDAGVVSLSDSGYYKGFVVIHNPNLCNGGLTITEDLEVVRPNDNTTITNNKNGIKKFNYYCNKMVLALAPFEILFFIFGLGFFTSIILGSIISIIALKKYKK